MRPKGGKGLPHLRLSAIGGEGEADVAMAVQMEVPPEARGPHPPPQGGLLPLNVAFQNSARWSRVCCWSA